MPEPAKDNAVLQHLNGSLRDVASTAAYLVTGAACLALGYVVVLDLQPVWTVDHGMAWGSGFLLAGGIVCMAYGLERGYYHVR